MFQIFRKTRAIALKPHTNRAQNPIPTPENNLFYNQNIFQQPPQSIIPFSKNQNATIPKPTAKNNQKPQINPAKTLKYPTKQQLIAYLCEPKTQTGSTAFTHLKKQEHKAKTNAAERITQKSATPDNAKWRRHNTKH